MGLARHANRPGRTESARFGEGPWRKKKPAAARKPPVARSRMEWRVKACRFQAPSGRTRRGTSLTRGISGSPPRRESDCPRRSVRGNRALSTGEGPPDTRRRAGRANRTRNTPPHGHTPEADGVPRPSPPSTQAQRQVVSKWWFDKETSNATRWATRDQGGRHDDVSASPSEDNPYYKHPLSTKQESGRSLAASLGGPLSFAGKVTID